MIRFLIAFLFCYSVQGQFIIDSYRYVSADSTNIYTTANAANDQNEANATTGVSTDAQISVSSVSSSPSPNGGTYSLLFNQDTSSGSSNDVNQITLNGVSNGDEVTVHVWAYEITGQAYTLRLDSGDGWVATDAVNVDSTSGFGQHTLTGTADADNPTLRVIFNTPSTTGWQIGIDTIWVIKTN